MKNSKNKKNGLKLPKIKKKGAQHLLKRHESRTPRVAVTKDRGKTEKKKLEKRKKNGPNITPCTEKGRELFRNHKGEGRFLGPAREGEKRSQKIGGGSSALKDSLEKNKKPQGEGKGGRDTPS